MKYRLKKDLPDCNAGNLFTRKDNDVYMRDVEDGSMPHFYEATLIDNPDWFEPIPERIELKFYGPQNHEIIMKYPVYEFTDKEFDLMEQAINGELFTKEDVLDLMRWNEENFVQNGAAHKDIFDIWLKSKKK